MSCAGIGFARGVKYLVRAALFNQFAIFHHKNVVGHRPHNRKIMTDKQVGKFMLFLQVSE